MTKGIAALNSVRKIVKYGETPEQDEVKTITVSPLQRLNAWVVRKLRHWLGLTDDIEQIMALLHSNTQLMQQVVNNQKAFFESAHSVLKSRIDIAEQRVSDTEDRLAYWAAHVELIAYADEKYRRGHRVKRIEKVT